MTKSNNISKTVTVKFSGTDIDKIIDFCILLSRRETKGFEIIEGELSGITPIPSTKPLKIKFNQPPKVPTEYINGQPNYRRTFQIPLDEFSSVDVGGRNAVREDIALESLILKIELKLEDLPFDLNECMEFIKNILKKRNINYQDFCACKKIILANLLSINQLENLKDDVFPKVRELMSEDKAHFLINLLEDINDNHLLISIAENYNRLDPIFRKYFSRCLKTLFNNLTDKQKDIPNIILNFVFNYSFRGEEFSDEEKMWVCEAFWFLDKASENTLEKLIDISSFNKYDFNIRAAALKSASKLLEGNEKSQKIFRKVVENILKEKIHEELRLVLIDSLAYAFNKQSPPSNEVIKKLTKNVKKKMKKDEEAIKGISALTLSKLVSYFISSERQKYLMKSYTVIGEEWLKTKIDTTRRACSNSLINFLFYGFPSNKINFENLFPRSFDFPNKQWSIIQIHKLDLDQVLKLNKRKILLNTADLPSMIVASISENFELTIKIYHLLSKHYNKVSRWFELKELVATYANFELLISKTQSTLNEISKSFQKCIDSVDINTEEYKFLLEVLEARMAFVNAFMEKKPTDKEHAYELWSKLVDKIEEAGDLHAISDINLTKSIKIFLMLSKLDLRAGDTMAKKFPISYHLRDGLNYANNSFSKALSQILNKKDGLEPPPQVEPTQYQPSIIVSPDVGLPEIIKFAEEGLGTIKNKKRSSYASKVINTRLPIIIEKLSFASFRLIGLQSIARDVVW